MPPVGAIREAAAAGFCMPSASATIADGERRK
jgi:hypothetical protein